MWNTYAELLVKPLSIITYDSFFCCYCLFNLFLPRGPFSSCGVGAALQSQHVGSVGHRLSSSGTQASCSVHVGSSQTREWARVSSAGRQILYHWATRKPMEVLLIDVWCAGTIRSQKECRGILYAGLSGTSQDNWLQASHLENWRCLPKFPKHSVAGVMTMVENHCSNAQYWVGQNVCLGFFITWYGKIQMNFLANPILSTYLTTEFACCL